MHVGIVKKTFDAEKSYLNIGDYLQNQGTGIWQEKHVARSIFNMFFK